MTTRDADPPPAEDRWTVKRLRTWTTDHFRKRGIESPALDADVLLDLDRVIQGELDLVTRPLIDHDRREQLGDLS